jgi:hypothetical protein
LLEGIGRRLWGFPPNLMRPIVDQLGPGHALSWFVSNMPRYEKTLSTYGPLRTHLLAMTVSLANGCPYCSYGHAFAFELAYFRTYDLLFPLDEDQIVALHGRDPSLIEERLRAALASTPLIDEAVWTERMVALIGGAEPAGADDARLAHLVSMFGVLNSCGIAANTPRDQAHDPLNKDTGLKARYVAVRSSGSA